MTLKSLDEFNKSRWDIWMARETPQHLGNGIACPMCGTEMQDSNPSVELTSYPPQTKIHCPNCWYTANRIV